MIIQGEWALCEDGFIRPLVRAYVFDAQENPIPVSFILDTGADRTLILAETYARLSLPPVGSRDQLSGLGGIQPSVQIDARIGFRTDNDHWLIYRSQYRCLTTPAALDLPLLGRDLLDIFTVIVDRPGDRVCMLTEDHPYKIE
jgi:Retroviral aspartyl protease